MLCYRRLTAPFLWRPHKTPSLISLYWYAICKMASAGVVRLEAEGEREAVRQAARRGRRLGGELSNVPTASPNCSHLQPPFMWTLNQHWELSFWKTPVCSALSFHATLEQYENTLSPSACHADHYCFPATAGCHSTERWYTPEMITVLSKDTLYIPAGIRGMR